MSDLMLRVVWPVVDVLMSDRDAMTEAWADLPSFAEHYQVTICGRPELRVAELSPAQQDEFKALRVVVCEAPVIRRLSRNTTPHREKEAA